MDFPAAPVLYRGVQVKRMKITKQTILYAILFAAFSLALHFITVYLLCHGTGLLLAGGDMLNSPEKWEIREKAENRTAYRIAYLLTFLLFICTPLYKTQAQPDFSTLRP